MSVPTTAEMPATTALHWVYTVFPALLRLTCGLAGTAAAFAVLAPPVHTPLLIVVVAVLTAWSMLFAAWTVRRNAPAIVAVVDILLTVGTCLLIRHLVAADVLPGGVSWVAIQASTSVIVAQFVLPVAGSVPAGLLIAAAYGVGAHLAGNDAEAVDHAVTLTLQAGCAAVLAGVARHSSRRADDAFAAYQETARAALTARAVRAAERRQNRDLHDTVLSTLTVVGLGAVGGQSALLRERAASDARTLAALAGARDPAGSVAGGDSEPDVGLDVRIRTLLTRFPQLPATVALEPCVVPATVATAIVESTGEALSNVVRHAPGATVTLRLNRIGRTVVVEVADDGPGFDPGTVPEHRYGLRESVRGRMATVGGRAEIDSAPGRGTRVRLSWADDD